MKVLVTGGAGFVGSHVVDVLVELGHEVTVLDNLSTGSEKNVNPAAKLVIDSAVRAKYVVRAHRAIIHCAATADISDNWRMNNNRAALWFNNVTSLMELLETASALHIKRFCFISTAAVYGGRHKHPVGTADITNAESPYAASKIAGEALVQAYGHRFGWKVSIPRLCFVGAEFFH